ncbi:hypothetical protein C8J56DRAFT_922815 [Mycena floridula]|nr:hypothetical protein C8J56DRAFT_922815 [Mycena floridula]
MTERSLRSESLSIGFRVFYFAVLVYSCIGVLRLVIQHSTSSNDEKPIYAKFSVFLEIIAAGTLVFELMFSIFIFLIATCIRSTRHMLPSTIYGRIVRTLRVIRKYQAKKRADEPLWDNYPRVVVLFFAYLLSGAIMNREEGSPLIAGSIQQIIRLAKHIEFLLGFGILAFAMALLVSLRVMFELARVRSTTTAPAREEPPITVALDLIIVIGRIATGTDSDPEDDLPSDLEQNAVGSISP